MLQILRCRGHVDNKNATIPSIAKFLVNINVLGKDKDKAELAVVIVFT